SFGFSNAGGTTRTHSYLHSRVTIGFDILDLGDAVRINLNHRNRNGNTIIGKYASHTALAADNTNRHFTNLYSVRGFYPLWPPISERYTLLPPNAPGVKHLLLINQD